MIMEKNPAADALRALAKDDANRSKIARLRELFVEIEATQKAGVTNTRIVETLNAQGFDLKLKTFETMMHRLRNESTKEKHPLRRSTDKQPVGAGPEVGTPASNSAGDEHPPSPKKITNPGEMHKAQRREINLSDYPES